VLSTFLLAAPFAATEAAATPAKKKASAAPLTAKSFSANGLSNEGTLTALFRGDFENVEFNREDMMFEVLFRHYLNAYAEKCKEQLPNDRVEITVKECKVWEVETNGFGVESRSCLRYEDVGTGLFAKPDLYAAKKEADRLLAADTLRQTWRLLLTIRQNPFAGATSMASATQAAENDMYALVQMSACTSPGLQRFEDNLRLFALNQPPIRLEEETGPSAVKALVSGAPGITLRDQDYAGLIEDLVVDHASTWAVNRFVSGSVTDVSIAARDAAGRPSKIVASYSYDGFNGRSQGSVNVHLTDGSPDCLYFFDAPAVCRTPNRKIAAAYAAGIQTGQPASVASLPPPAFAEPAGEPVAVEPVAAPAEPPPPPAPKRQLKSVNYIQGIKDACLEVLTGGDRREPETSYCFCLSASVGSIPVSDADAQWFFENFSDEAIGELERRYAGLVRRFGSCRAQLEANR
jgi:hypothetical protein